MGMKTCQQRGAESNEGKLENVTKTHNTQDDFLGHAVGRAAPMRVPHPRMRQDRSSAEPATRQQHRFCHENSAATGAAKLTRKRMNLGPELILMLAASVVLGLVGLCAARAADGELISPKGVPKTGSFWRMQRQTPPLPFNPFPDLSVYALDWSRNIFLIDDRSVDYEQWEQEWKALFQADGPEHWDSAITNFVVRSISLPDTFGGTFEHVTFAPIGLPPQ
jgi:hypothetical protein